MSNKIKSKLKYWSIAFDVCLAGIFVLTALALGSQLWFTNGQLSTDLNNINNWKTLASTFSFPIGVATAMLAITSLIGLYQRSLQLSLQLEKVEEQIAISNRQFKNSNKQFRLSQKQYLLAHRKENYILYCEHKKQLEEHCNRVMNGMRNREGIYFEIDYEKLYRIVFPENSYNKMENFSLNSRRFYSGITEEIIVNLDKMSECLTPFMHPDTPSYKLDECFASIGIYIFKHKLLNIDGNVLKLEIFLEITYEICGLLNRLSIIQVENFRDFQEIINRIEKKYKITKTI